MKPIIGITSNISQISSEDRTLFDVNYSPLGFSQAIEYVGGTPILLPIMSQNNAKELISLVDGLLLTGGEDISPCFYNEEPRIVIGATSPQRDQSEIWLIQEAMNQKKPILGICRGMQLINVVLGGSLYQDLSEHPHVSVQHVQKAKPHISTHSIQVEENSYVSTLFETGSYVNSFHHQALKTIGSPLKVTAWSHDNIPEAIEYFESSQSILGLQWHPELNALKENTQSLAVFKDLVQRSRSTEKQQLRSVG